MRVPASVECINISNVFHIGRNAVQRVKARTIYLKKKKKNFLGGGGGGGGGGLRLSAQVYEDPNYVQIPFNKSWYA